jgi:hypothetical protein
LVKRRCMTGIIGSNSGPRETRCMTAIIV